jgi:hypothetical protein
MRFLYPQSERIANFRNIKLWGMTIFKEKIYNMARPTGIGTRCRRKTQSCTDWGRDIPMPGSVSMRSTGKDRA